MSAFLFVCMLFGVYGGVHVGMRWELQIFVVVNVCGGLVAKNASV